MLLPRLGGRPVPKFHLVLLIHAHQPVGNFEDVFERAYQQSYLPFVGLLEKHPAIRVGMHYSGVLLEWIERAHPEYFKQVRELVKREQVEIAGGGFYEPILISLPPEDRTEQIHRLADYIEKHFGQRPQGAWLTERVWEPELASTLARAGVKYTLTDDNHFLGAGFEPQQLYGSYLAEDQGETVEVIPGLKALRYLIPYRNPEETIEFLRAASQAHPDGFAAMGDDCEKFGVWPKSYQHCYVDKWLERFFIAIEANAEWLETTTPGKALAARHPLGRAYLPTTSYLEMTEWALPTESRKRFEGLLGEFAARGDVMQFLHGGIWRNFFAKYTESNLLHKKMLHVSAKVRRLANSKRGARGFEAKKEAAQRLLLRAQCNDAFWHGIFGGLYSPHLRTALWRSAIGAETIADAASGPGGKEGEIERGDYDADGREEIYVTAKEYAALISTADGGTIAALDMRKNSVALVNSLMRRKETYHDKVHRATVLGSGDAGAVSIHDQVVAKEANLERFLRYDRWQRHAFRLLVFDAAKTQQDYEMLRLEEDALLAGGDYEAVDARAKRVRVRLADSNAAALQGALRAEKTFTFAERRNGFDVQCDFAVTTSAAGTRQAKIGMETVINLLAPEAADRYFEAGGKRHALRWSAATPASHLRIVDEWQKIAVTLEAPDAESFWIAPIETISESEEGFERVYQGSQILAVWPAEISSGKPCKGRLVLRVQALP
ncbi:MAG: alpha-amylase/4-alpha-glucanotransferase domain-containing protein [Candidatus Acidiferrales bacterium]